MNTEKIIADFQLIGNRILNLNLVNNFVKLEDTEDLNREFEVDFSLGNIDKLENFIIGTITLDVDCSIKNEKEKEIRANIAIEGCFISHSLLNSEKEFKEMLCVNGSASLYSIARAIIISITSQALFGGEVILPLINTHQLVREKFESQELENTEI